MLDSIGFGIACVLAAGLGCLTGYAMVETYGPIWGLLAVIPTAPLIGLGARALHEYTT